MRRNRCQIANVKAQQSKLAAFSVHLLKHKEILSGIFNSHQFGVSPEKNLFSVGKWEWAHSDSPCWASKRHLLALNSFSSKWSWENVNSYFAEGTLRLSGEVSNKRLMLLKIKRSGFNQGLFSHPHLSSLDLTTSHGSNEVKGIIKCESGLPQDLYNMGSALMSLNWSRLSKARHRPSEKVKLHMHSVEGGARS